MIFTDAITNSSRRQKDERARSKRTLRHGSLFLQTQPHKIPHSVADEQNALSSLAQKES